MKRSDKVEPLTDEQIEKDYAEFNCDPAYKMPLEAFKEMRKENKYSSEHILNTGGLFAMIELAKSKVNANAQRTQWHKEQYSEIKFGRKE